MYNSTSPCSLQRHILEHWIWILTQAFFPTSTDSLRAVNTMCEYTRTDVQTNVKNVYESHPVITPKTGSVRNRCATSVVLWNNKKRSVWLHGKKYFSFQNRAIFVGVRYGFLPLIWKDRGTSTKRYKSNESVLFTLRFEGLQILRNPTHAEFTFAPTSSCLLHCAFLIPDCRTSPFWRLVIERSAVLARACRYIRRVHDISHH